MKNVKVLYEPDEIREYFRKKFKTPLFQAEFDKPGSFIRKVVDRAAKYPMFIYEFSDHPSRETPDKDKTEWAHFGSWMGGVTDRDYPNDAVHDAYWLHELFHKGYMSYVPDMTFEGFKDKIFRNELNASMTSELELYFRHPEFRKDTFGHEIYADRFLDDPHFMKRWEADPDGVRDEVRLKRRELMMRENKNDPVEYWIHKFAQQNEAWAAIWSRRYNQVESKMAELHQDIDKGMSRQRAMDKYMAWLQSKEVTQGTEIPFPDEAEAFAAVYRLNGRHYQHSIEQGKLALEHPATEFVKSAYPGLAPKDALAGPIATELHGALPPYAGRKKHLVSGVTLSAQGSYAVTYAIDPTIRNAAGRLGEPVLVFQKRGDKGPNGEDRFGLFGGFTSLDHFPEKNMVKEQPAEGCARELREETVNDKGVPVLNPDPSRLKLLHVHHDFRADIPTTATGHTLELTPQELAACRAHSDRMASDPEYAAAAKEASHGEVAQMYVKPLREVLQMSREQFTHPHEFEAIQLFAKQLEIGTNLTSSPPIPM